MPSDASRLTYVERINRVKAYIRAHLDEPLDLDALADIACYSRFHWHRVYRAMTGETAAQTVRRMRLARAAHQLINTQMRITEIADAAGYSSQSAFSRAFSAAYGGPPNEFREDGDQLVLKAARRDEDASAFNVDIRDFPARPALALVHAGPYNEIGSTFDRLFFELEHRGLMSHVRGPCGVYTDDPDTIPAEDLRAHAAALVDRDGLECGELEPLTLGGGRYAVLRYKGPYAAIQPAYDWLLGVWMPQTEVVVRDDPVLELNLNSPLEAAPSELLTDIYLPLVDP